MPWQTLSLHFKQTYEGAYRYLDRCGEFLLAAQESLDLIPVDAKPSGAKLDLPEKGLNVTCDTASLTVMQELPLDEGQEFFRVCEAISRLFDESFRPIAIARNGFAWKSYWPYAKVEEMLRATLKVGGNTQVDLGKVVNMIPDHKKLDYMFNSGSKELHVVLQPGTFERVETTKRNASFRATREERRRVDRANTFAERVNRQLSHAIIMEVDLMEDRPPEAVLLKRHFEELRSQTDALRKYFAIT